MNASNDAELFVLLADAVPDAIEEIRYYTTYNFVGKRIDGYEEPAALLTLPAARALRKVSDGLVRRGFRIRVYDAYRPLCAVSHFMRWARDSADTRMKRYFYPELEKDMLIPGGYIAERSAHSRGSAVDVTLFDMDAGTDADMGGAFDLFSGVSRSDCGTVTLEQRANRALLRDAMASGGFRPLKEEWWHFTLEGEPYPDTYFTFPVRRSSAGRRNAR